MNIAKLTTTNTIEAINARKESLVALEEALTRKVTELREICLKEGELTGQLPVEYPLQPREPLPLIRRRVEMPPPKEPPKRTTSTTSSKLPTSITTNSHHTASAVVQKKHSSSHAIKFKESTPSPLGENNKMSKLDDIHQQILQIQSVHDHNIVLSMPTNGARSNGNFPKVRPVELDGLTHNDTRSRAAPVRNRSESCIDDEKARNRQKLEAPLKPNREAPKPARNGLHQRADISSISFKTMIQPTSSTRTVSSHHDPNGLSKPTTSQSLLQSIKLANLEQEILRLQASQSNHGLPNENHSRISKLTNSKTLGSLDAVNITKDNILHQRVVSDGGGHLNQHLQSQRFGGLIAVQSDDVKVTDPGPKSPPKQSFNITEIPAESVRGKSPTIPFADSVGDENVNPLTSKISQLSITGVGNFQPYWEETKPYELSDFYKYSAKHRTGGNIKSNSIKEKVRNLEEAFAAKSSAQQRNDKNIVADSKKLAGMADNNNQNTIIDNNNRRAQKTQYRNDLSSASSSTSSKYHHLHAKPQQSTANNRSLAPPRYAH